MEIPSELKLQRRTIELEAKEKGGKQGEKGEILAEDSSEQPAAQPLASKQTKQTDNRCINKGRQIEQVKSGRLSNAGKRGDQSAAAGGSQQTKGQDKGSVVKETTSTMVAHKVYKMERLCALPGAFSK
ncbi:hypothetical protein RUM44_009170 [Polyplax serrata]|uniref:Uncharacterized protein n=1 Tax=Polyplax serrata TaxID=468196 RepID=A0ABR1ARY3_POLSC